MPSMPLCDNVWIDITPADLTVDQHDIVLMLTTIARLNNAGPCDRAACDRLARLAIPYIDGITVEQLGDVFATEQTTITRVFNRVLLYFLFARRSNG
jgi:hypothetical protein